MPLKRPILIDTDAGTDDAVALCVMMNSDQFDIIGITTVGGNAPVDNVTQNVLYLTETWGKSIPVYQGAARPLCRPTISADFIHGKDGLGDIGIDNRGRTPASGYAPEHIIHLSHQYSGQLELLTLGPLTNVAIALALDPTLPTRIKACHIMGGLYHLPGNITPLSEYNIWADPEAMRAVLDTPWDNITMTGWDATLSGGFLTPDQLDLLRHQPHPMSADIAHMQDIAVRWEEKNNGHAICYLADAAAALALTQPEIIKSSINAHASVLCSADDAPERGQIVTTEGHNIITYITEIDQPMFVDLILKTFE